jgi:hypothetical protein
MRGLIKLGSFESRREEGSSRCLDAMLWRRLEMAIHANMRIETM